MTQDEGPRPTPRRWRVLGAGTAVVTLAVWAMVFAIVTAPDAEESSDAGALSLASLLLAIALVPLVFYVVARLSGRERPGRVATRAFGIAFAAVPVTFVAGDPVTGLVAGLGLGGAYSYTLGEHHTLAARWWGVGLATIYTWVLLRVVVGLALLLVPLLPLGSIGLADAWRERKAAQSGSRDGRR